MYVRAGEREGGSCVCVCVCVCGVLEVSKKNKNPTLRRLGIKINNKEFRYGGLALYELWTSFFFAA